MTPLLEFLKYTPIVEVVVALFWLWSLISAWKSAPTPTSADDIGERTLGATVIMGQLSSVITGSSIILAGIGAFIAIKSGNILYPQNYHLFYTVAWAVLALGISVYTMGVLPTRTPNENFVRSPSVSILCSMALFFCLAAAARFLVAVWAILQL